MPFRMLFSHPIGLAALVVIAVGVVTYQILSNQKKKLPASGRRHSRGSGDGFGGSDYYTDDSKEPEKSSTSPIGPSVDTRDSTSGTVSSPRQSEKHGNDLTGLRKRINASRKIDDTLEPENSSINFSDGNDSQGSTPSSSDKNSELDLNHPFGPVDKQNNEIQKVNNNISQVKASGTSFVANISEDSDSSESNNSLSSVETNDTNTNLNLNLDTSILCTTINHKSIQVPSPENSEEEIYKKKVHDYLKGNMESGNSSTEYYKEKHIQNLNDEDSDISDDSLSVTSHETGISVAIEKKPKMCEGCLEDRANAVNYPCRHCYLCLDCAIKVHRIFKKCNVCYSVIKSFEIERTDSLVTK